MMLFNNGEERYCRVVGLKSAEGLKRNGSAAKVVLPFSPSAEEIRLSVAVDGFPGPMSIKMSNLSMMPRKGERKFKILTVGVGRGTFLDTTFKTVLADDAQVLSGDIMSGTSARSRGNLVAVDSSDYDLQCNHRRICRQYLPKIYPKYRTLCIPSHPIS